MKIKIKPSKEGLKVVKPDTNRDLDPQGEVVEQSSYWLRRLAEGDVVLIEEMKEENEPLKPAKAKEQKNEGGLK